MTKAELKQYRSICAEIAELNIRLKDKEVYGAVRGSDNDFPYTQHTISVKGITVNSDTRRLIARRGWLLKQKDDIDNFINGIEDSLTRRIFEERYVKGTSKPTWTRVAFIIGGGNTAEGIQMIHKRYLDKM